MSTESPSAAPRKKLPLKERYALLGVEPVSSTPEQFGQFIQAEAAKYAKLIKEIGFQPL